MEWFLAVNGLIRRTATDHDRVLQCLANSPDAIIAVYAQLETRRSPDGTEEWLNWIVVRSCHPERERGAWPGGRRDDGSVNPPPAPPGPSLTLGVTEPIGLVQATISGEGD